MSLQQARIFLNDIKKSAIYAGIGRVGEWNENDIPSGVESPDSIVQDFRDTVLFKKTFPGQYTLAIDRYDWATGEVYAQWNDKDESLKTKQFYTINESGQIYKCLFNNNDSPSTEMPNSVSVERFETSDGYVWKLIASVPYPIALQFNNSNYSPIQTVSEPLPGYELQFASQSAAIAGTLDRVDVVQSGKKYSNQTRVFIVGDGSGAKCEPVIHAITGEIVSIKVLSHGTGYTQATVVIDDSAHVSGSEAIAVPILSPVGGHGADPEKELFSNTVLAAISLVGDESGHIKNSFDFRSLGLYSGIESVVEKVSVYPNDGLTYKNSAQNFKLNIKSGVDSDSLIMKVNDVVFTVNADPANPYGEPDNLAIMESSGITVSYLDSVWKFEFDKAVSLITQETTVFFELRKDGVSVFGNYLAPSSDNTLNYTFRDHTTVSNEPKSFAGDSPVNGVIYDYTIPLSITGLSGDFEMGESVEFLNGETATVVYAGLGFINVSSSDLVMSGEVKGLRSGASAIVTTVGNRPFKPTKNTVAIDQQKYTKQTKLTTGNIVINAIFSF